MGRVSRTIGVRPNTVIKLLMGEGADGVLRAYEPAGDRELQRILPEGGGRGHKPRKVRIC